MANILPAHTTSAPGAAFRALNQQMYGRIAHAKRCRAAGQPSDAELTRMLAEYAARGGQITQCPTAYVLPVQNGAGRNAAG